MRRSYRRVDQPCRMNKSSPLEPEDDGERLFDHKLGIDGMA